MPVPKPKYSDWSFIDKLVDPNAVNRGAGGVAGNLLNFISSESTLVAAGPATLAGGGGVLANVTPIGVIQSFNISQNKNIAQLFEIGSKETILLPGRTFIQSSISRLLLDGPSLMKALYSTYTDSDGVGDGEINPTTLTGYSETSAGLIDTAGNGNFYINLASSLFSVPFGMALLLHDVNNEVYAGCYLENCSIASHSISFSAGQTVVAENCSIRVSKIKPVKFTNGSAPIT